MRVGVGERYFIEVTYKENSETDLKHAGISTLSVRKFIYEVLEFLG